MSAAAIIIMHQRRAMRQFREAGATAPTSPRGLEELQVRRTLGVRRLIAAGVLREVRQGAYYLDERRAADYVQRQRTRMLVFCVVVVVIGIAIMLLAAQR